VKIAAAVASIDQDFWRARKVLVTGHTGFKGAWLSLWLQSLGAEVVGVANGPPPKPSLYGLADVAAHMASELACDVRDAAAVREAIGGAGPEVVLHLAAQPVVRLSLREPALTFGVNVLGTVNVLEAVRRAGGSVRAVVIVTSDKCYANPAGYAEGEGVADGQAGVAAREASGPGDSADAAHCFVEGDPLGGRDPYSASKACAELVTAAYRDSFFGPGGVDASGSSGAGRSGGADGPALAGMALGAEEPADRGVQVASARAGNVIGGGDFGEDRLVPDILKAYDEGRPVKVRNPEAIRPWQHVLNPLSGYLALAQALCADGGAGFAKPFNFGPRRQDARTVLEIVRRLDGLLPGGLGYELDAGEHPPEALRLELDSSAAERELGWRPRWGLNEALAEVAAWHGGYRRGEAMRTTSLKQIAAFC
jgi:CDP-glucose 4,6-dehydratase